MKIVITGGIGSGKSTIGKMIAEKLGISYYSFDTIVHNLYMNFDVCAKLNDVFGVTDRDTLSDMAFNDPLVLAKLEEVFNPFIKEAIESGPMYQTNMIFEFPLLFEKGKSYITLFDAVVSVTAPKQLRIERVLARGNMSIEKIKNIMNLQCSDSVRVDNSDYIIVNDTVFNDVDGVLPQVNEVVSQLRGHVVKDSGEKLKIGLVSGSFDPITLGHTWVIQKALDIVDEVVITVAINNSKKQLFTPEERGQLIRDTMKEILTAEQLARVSVNYIKADEMTVSYANHIGAKFIFRGLRNSTDFEYENQLNLLQKKIAPEIETIFLITPRELIEISSSLIKASMTLREWERVAQPYVSNAVFQKLKEVTSRNK